MSEKKRLHKDELQRDLDKRNQEILNELGEEPKVAAAFVKHLEKIEVKEEALLLIEYAEKLKKQVAELNALKKVAEKQAAVLRVMRADTLELYKNPNTGQYFTLGRTQVTALNELTTNINGDLMQIDLFEAYDLD